MSYFKVLETINFFLYDSIKIISLLFFMVFIVSFLRSYLSMRKLRDKMTKQHPLVAYFTAAIFGAITPFCSCSSIPIFLSFLKAGLRLGVCLAFLVTSPIINEYLVVLMLGFFGFKITAIYVVSGILLGVASGIILSTLKLENQIYAEFKAHDKEIAETKFKNIKQRIIFAYSEAKSMVKNLWLWVLVGVGLGAFIHNYVPQALIQTFLEKGGHFTVPIAVLLGVPIYGSCTAIVPIAVALFQKGIPLGTALAFMMAVSALSLPEFIILKRAMKLKLLLLFFGIVALGIIFTGYLINFFA